VSGEKLAVVAIVVVLSKLMVCADVRIGIWSDDFRLSFVSMKLAVIRVLHDPGARMRRRCGWHERSRRIHRRPMSRAFAGTQYCGPALHKNFRSCYDCNEPDVRRQRASAAASSALAKGQRSTSEIPASASALTLTSIVDGAASSIGLSGTIS
jgi:hypothetical protein